MVSVVGRSRSGRTTLLEGLIAELERRGYRVATAKHHAHETDVDVPGKDSWRHARAGAVLTMVSAPNNLGVFSKVGRERTLAELTRIASDADILLTEGFSRVSPTKVEVVRAERSKEPLFASGDLFALVTDVRDLEAPGTPMFALDDLSGLSDLIERTFLEARESDESFQQKGSTKGTMVGRAKGHASPAVYLDHAATSWPKPRQVIEAATRAMTELGGSPGRSAHGMALSVSRAVLEARRRCAGLLGVADPRDLLFQPGCTAACNLMLGGLLEPGDRVVVGSMEHNAVARPLARLADCGVEIVVVKADMTGLVDPGDVEKEVRARRTRAVVCQHASNVTGTIQLVCEMAEVAHENGALLLVDGAQAAGHIDLDLSALGSDAYALSGHKGLLGPQGVGLIHLSPGLEVREQVLGGTGGESGSIAMPVERPERYEAGTLNTLGIVGVGAAAAYLAENAEEIRKRESGLARRLHEGILEIGGFRVLGPSLGAPRVPLVSIVHSSIEADRLAFLLDRDHEVATRAGLHCAPWAHETVGTLGGGALRIAVGWRTTTDEIDLVLGALSSMAGGEGRRN